MKTFGWLPPLLLGIFCLGCNNSQKPAAIASLPPPAPKQPPVVLLSIGVDPIGAFTYSSEASNQLYVRCSEPIESMEWDLGGGGKVISDQPHYVSVKWGAPGQYSGRVLVKTANGQVETSFEYEVAAVPVKNDGTDASVRKTPIQSTEARHWTRVPLAFLHGYNAYTVATVLDGKPVVAALYRGEYGGNAGGVVAFARIPVPMTTEDWHVTPLPEDVARPQLMVEHEGRIQVLYLVEDYDVRWASANTKVPTSPADWTIRDVPVVDMLDFGFLNGRPVALAVSDYMAIGRSAKPINEDDWHVFRFNPVVPPLESPTGMGMGHSDFTDGFWWQSNGMRKSAALFVVDGHLLMPSESNHGLTMTVARIENPSSSEDFVRYLLPPDNGEAAFQGFVLNGRLSILVTKATGGNTHHNRAVWYEATETLPLTAVDWRMGYSESVRMNGYFDRSIVIDDLPLLLEGGWSGFVHLFRGASNTVDADTEWEVAYTQGNFGPADPPCALLATAAGPAILIGSVEKSGPVLVYPDLSTNP